jgi:hypothetical protein
VVDAAKRYDAWGHRKIWGVLRLEDTDKGASQSTVKRVMGRNGLLQPFGYQAERRQLVGARKFAFLDGADATQPRVAGRLLRAGVGGRRRLAARRRRRLLGEGVAGVHHVDAQVSAVRRARRINRWRTGSYPESTV